MSSCSPPPHKTRFWSGASILFRWKYKKRDVFDKYIVGTTMKSAFIGGRYKLIVLTSMLKCNNEIAFLDS